MNDPLINIISEHKNGKLTGIFSVCSSNEYVLEASLHCARKANIPLLIESTSNQVNQFGGYTGKDPKAFSDFVKQMANQKEFATEKLILGGDHLGPNPWQNEQASDAMAKAKELIRNCVKAGYRKIHLDASMRCADDPGSPETPLDPGIVAERSAELCATAEKATKENSDSGSRPLYVIGTDVPIPGGAQKELQEIHSTPVEEVENTIQLTKKAFMAKGLESAWQRVIAVVVQPGVEFGDSSVFVYDSKKASELSDFIENYEQLVYEAHSTDYQPVDALKQLVKDHFAILKVGPALTFAFREAVFSLAFMEKELLAGNKHIELSYTLDIIEKVMANEPRHWYKHYHGNDKEKLFARKYSYSDRIRYYWTHPSISAALKTLISNLSENPVPFTLLSQFMPMQYDAVKEGKLLNKPIELIRYPIGKVLNRYTEATTHNEI